MNKKGFTIIELLIVLAIIGILAAITLPAFLQQKKKFKQTYIKKIIFDNKQNDLSEKSFWTIDYKNNILNLCSNSENWKSFDIKSQQEADAICDFVRTGHVYPGLINLNNGTVNMLDNSENHGEKVKEVIIDNTKTSKEDFKKNIIKKIVEKNTDNMTFEELDYYKKHTYEIDKEVEKYEEIKMRILFN